MTRLRGRRTTAKQAEIAERRTKMVRMRLAGLDWDTIAERLEYSNRAAACKDLSRTLTQYLAEQNSAVEELREVELMRLDRLLASVWTAAIGGDNRAVETAIKVIDRRCKLLGLDAPVRAEVMTVDAIDAEIHRLTRELGAGIEAVEAGTAPQLES